MAEHFFNSSDVSVLYQKHFYQVRNESITFDAANTFAAALVFKGVNGHLATLTTVNETDYASALQPDTLWIAVHDVDGTGSFTYSAGPEATLPMVYSDWVADQPDGLCVLVNSVGAEWAAVGCQNRTLFIVEYECPTGFVFGAFACEPAATLFDGRFYERRPELTTWGIAGEFARALVFKGVIGHLAAITTRAENQYASSVAGLDAWIGVSDLPVRGAFKYSGGPENGLAVNFTAWAANEPAVVGTTNDCVEVHNGSWVDTQCSNLLPFVVEYECPPGFSFGLKACVSKFLL